MEVESRKVPENLMTSGPDKQMMNQSNGDIGPGSTDQTSGIHVSPTPAFSEGAPPAPKPSSQSSPKPSPPPSPKPSLHGPGEPLLPQRRSPAPPPPASTSPPPPPPAPPQTNGSILPPIHQNGRPSSGTKRPSSGTKTPTSTTKRPPSASSITKTSPRPASKNTSRPSSAQKTGSTGDGGTPRNRPDSASKRVRGSQESVKNDTLNTEQKAQKTDIKEEGLKGGEEKQSEGEEKSGEKLEGEGNKDDEVQKQGDSEGATHVMEEVRDENKTQDGTDGPPTAGEAVTEGDRLTENETTQGAILTQDKPPAQPAGHQEQNSEGERSALNPEPPVLPAEQSQPSNRKVVSQDNAGPPAQTTVAESPDQNRTTILLQDPVQPAGTESQNTDKINQASPGAPAQQDNTRAPAQQAAEETQDVTKPTENNLVAAAQLAAAQLVAEQSGNQTMTEQSGNQTITDQSGYQTTTDQSGNQSTTDQSGEKSSSPTDSAGSDKGSNVTKKNKPKLTGEQVTGKATRLMETLLNMETYDTEQCNAAMKSLGRLYWDQKSFRSTVCQILLDMDFASLAVKMVTYFNNVGIFKNDDIWFPAYYTLNNTWNYSDASLKLAKELGEKGFIRLMIANITHQPYLDNLGSKNVTYVIKSSLSILQNISKIPEVKQVFTENKALEALKPFTTSDNDFFKATSMMTMTSLITEADNAVLDDTGVIPFFVKSIGRALKSKNRRHRGFTLTELTACLGRMAVNDNNKMKIVAEGALPYFLVMLESGDEEEQTAVSQCLWTLSFDKDARDKILAEEGLEVRLEQLTAHDNKDLKRAARGAMWKLRGEEEHGKQRDIGQTSQTDDVKTQQHIMISYNWDSQTAVLQLADRLKADGYKVWLDLDQMGGSTLEAMALAVEDAALVLICYSDKYKNSPNCRTEGEYTFQLKKPIVPCLMQLKYKADGWLGMLLGAKLFINFAGKYPFDKAYKMLLKEINGRGHPGMDHVDSAQTVSETGSLRPQQNPVTTKTASSIRDWSKHQVTDWLLQHGLQRCKEAFADIDGKLLSSLLTIREEAPEYFYVTLEKKLGLSLVETLTFMDAISSL